MSLDAILADVEDALEVTVEIDSAKRTDGTLKTWYFSTHARGTGGSESPANTEFLPFLVPGGTLGPLSQSLSEDVLFSGLAANNPGTITLIQSSTDNDQLSELNDYVFAGYETRIKIGRAADLYAAFATYRTVTVKIDPTVQLTSEGIQASFQLSSAMGRMLEERLIVRKYLGIPHCLRLLTVTGVVTATRQAAHDVSRFTIGIRFRINSIPTTEDRRIWTKVATFPTNSHWRIVVMANTGVLYITASSGGVADINYTGSTNLCDGNWHSIIFSRNNDQAAYIIVDGAEEITYTPTGTVNLSAVDLLFGKAFSGNNQLDLCDARMIDRYMQPEEARGYFSVRSEGSDLNCIGLWRFDDNTGGTVNDYSPTAADGVISGVVNTDYSWKESDLGEPELAGKNYPIVIGNVINARAHLIDSNRERYRGNDGSSHWYSSGSNSNLTVRSQGTVLTAVTDYSAPSNGGGGVFQMTSQEAEPVTYDLLNNGTNEELTYPSYITYYLLSTRTRILSGDISNVDPLTLLCPWPSGYWTDQETTAQQALAEILGESGMYYLESYNGSIWLDMLLPPTGYGPYGEPCLDLRGRVYGGVSFGDLGDISGSCTLAGWVKVALSDQTAYNFGSSEPNIGTAYLVAKNSTAGNYSVYFQSIGTSAGKLAFRIAGTTLKTSAGVIAPFTWNFFACVFDDTANTMKMYLAPKGSTLLEVTSTTNSSSPVTNSDNLMIGGTGFPWVSVQYIQVWNTVKNLSALQSLMATPPIGNESGLVAYLPLNEGEGDPYEKVTNTQGEIEWTGPGFDSLNLPQWAPKLVIDLDETPSVKLTDFHHTHPASDVIVKYEKNRYPMDNADIDTGVSQNNRLKLTSESKSIPLENAKIRNRFKNSKKIDLDTPFVDQESAQRLSKVIASRFGTDNYIGTLTFPPGLNISRLACGLVIGDEIGLTGTIPSQIQTPRSFRVVAVAPNLLKLSTTIVIAG